MKTTAIGLALVLSILSADARSNDCAPGPEGNRCKAENGDPRAMYLIGREAYLEARESGDFSEAHMWATRAKEAGFLAGRMLFKMVHMQAGDGLHHDYVEAHHWITTAIADGADYLVPYKRRLEARMTNEQIAEALSTK
jgi:TPR repeat protein